MRAVTFGMAMVVLLGFWYFVIASLLGPGSSRSAPFQSIPRPDRAVIGIVLWACYLTCAICVIPFLLLYFLHYRRKLQKTQQEQILATLVDLQHRSPSFVREGHRTGSDTRRAGIQRYGQHAAIIRAVISAASGRLALVLSVLGIAAPSAPRRPV